MSRYLRFALFVLFLASPHASAQEGMVLYTRGSLWDDGTIHLATLDENGAVVSDLEVFTGAAHEPKFSPDGRQIAFVRDSDKKLLTMNLDGTEILEHTTCAGDTYPLGSWRTADSIYLNGGKQLLRYDLSTGQTTPVLSSEQDFRELDISENLRGVHGGMPPVYSFDLYDGSDGFAYDHCGGSISQDGNIVTNCRTDHRGFYLRAWGDFDNYLDNFDTPTSNEALDPQFSGNSNDHILCNVKNNAGKYNVWLLTITTRQWIRITDDSVDDSGSDFFFGTPVQPEPQLALDPSILSFSVKQGQANPGPKAVSVTNSGSGILDSVGVSNTYQQGSAWLSLRAEGSGNQQTVTNTVDIAGLAPGDYNAAVEVSCANADNSPMSYTVSLQITDLDNVPIRINCGSNDYTPSGWREDDSYLTGGSDYDFGGTWDTSTSNAAPESVYKTVRHQDHSYSFPDLPNGKYKVRIHFGDDAASDTRRMVYSIEGAQVLSDFSPGVDAGGGFIALVKDFVVTVSDGNGLQIEASEGDGEDVFESGIEILDYSDQQNQAPEVDAGDDVLVDLGDSAFLFGNVSDDGLPGPLTVNWSQVSGPGSVSFGDPHESSTNVSFPSLGDYVLRLTADDGELQGYDEVHALVTQGPSILLLSPVGGEIWRSGTSQTIRWEATKVTDVEIRYSVDNGASWDVITYTIDDSSPDWGNFPWQVPDSPSRQCLVRIVQYNASEPVAISPATFEIVSSSTTDGGKQDAGSGGAENRIDGSCGCNSPSGQDGWSLVLFFLAYLFLRRSRP